MITMMKEDQMVLRYRLCKTHETDLPEVLEALLQKRREVYMANCPREFQHLVDLKEWYWIDRYNQEMDTDQEVLITLVDSSYRMVLLHSETDLQKENTEEKKVHFVPMQYGENIYLAYPVDTENANAYLSKVIASTMEMSLYSEDSYDPLVKKGKMVYDDSLIARLVRADFIPVTGISYLDITKKTKGIALRHYKDLYLVEIEESSTGNFIIDFTTMKKDEELLMLGDLVQYDSNTCLILGVRYGEILEDYSSHLYTICNTKRSSEYTREVTGLELEKI